jgi:hypothetical protein
MFGIVLIALCFAAPTLAQPCECAPPGCTAGYPGSDNQCFCWCNSQAKGRQGVCHWYAASGTFSRGGCAFCPGFFAAAGNANQNDASKLDSASSLPQEWRPLFINDTYIGKPGSEQQQLSLPSKTATTSTTTGSRQEIKLVSSFSTVPELKVVEASTTTTAADENGVSVAAAPGPFFAQRCYCPPSGCKFGGPRESCLSFCQEKSKQFQPPGAWTMNFMPSGSWGMGQCGCCGNVDPCNVPCCPA